MSGERRHTFFSRRKDSLNVGRHGLLGYHVERSDTRNQEVRIQSYERSCEDWRFVTEVMATVC